METVEELGEHRVVDAILAVLKKRVKPAIPFGDDVSAIKLGRKKLLVLKTDTLVWDTDVPPGMTARQAGRKALVMSVSDLAAKGVKPLAAVASLSIPPSTSIGDALSIVEGLEDGAREYGLQIVGGDTGEAPTVVLSVSVVGIADKEAVILRSGARVGDVVASTGLFGCTATALAITLNGLEAPRELKSKVLQSVYEPKARLREGLVLSSLKAATSSIDSSDGLAWSLYELSRMSGVGFKITHVPIAPEAEAFARIHGLNPLNLALYGGEEYELVLTIKPELFDKAAMAVRSVGGALIRMGEVIKEKRVVVDYRGELREVEAKGWEHFAPKRSSFKQLSLKGVG